jgi:hypothetical protein
MHRTADACNPGRAPHGRWIEEAHITQLTGLLRDGPGGGQLAEDDAGLRPACRPHAATLFETGGAPGDAGRVEVRQLIQLDHGHATGKQCRD